MAKKTSQLRDKLEPYGLHETGKLADALGVKKQQASRWLLGAPYEVSTARRIAEAIGLSWQEVYSWQENGR